MSVEIYDVLNNEEPSRITVPVAAESVFESVWASALQELNIDRLGNGVWLRKNELDLLLKDFLKVREWVIEHCSVERANNIAHHIDYILEQLPQQWGRNPDIEQLWMG